MHLDDGEFIPHAIQTAYNLSNLVYIPTLTTFINGALYVFFSALLI